MSDETLAKSRVEDLLASAGSRKHFLTGAAALAAGIGIAPAAASAAALQGKNLKGMSESAQSILNIAATAEAAAVTVLYNVHVAVNSGKFDTSGIAISVPMLVKIVRGILRQEQDHYAFLTGAGAKPLQLSFSAPAPVFAKATEALKFLELADGIFVAAYMAANREFAAGGMNKLVQYTYQIGGTEAAHRSLARAGLGKLPNNRSYEKNLFNHVAGAARVLGELGVLKPGVPYPGAMAVDHILGSSFDRNRAAGVTQRTP